jgi:ribulose-phosphate 3-epimerase
MFSKGIIDPMNFRPIIAASILSADFSQLGAEIKATEEGGADWIHVDIMDGHFVPNITMGPFIVDACKSVTDLPLDVHLMIEEPEKLVPAFVKAGASRLTVHVEACPHLHRTLQAIQAYGITAGVALNPGTPITTITEVVEEVDLILIMTVNPGFGGQKIIKSTLDKVQLARDLLLSHGLKSTHIEVDGGIDSATIMDAAKAGADVFVAGTSIFKHSTGAQVGTQNLIKALEQEGVKN